MTARNARKRVTINIRALEGIRLRNGTLPHLLVLFPLEDGLAAERPQTLRTLKAGSLTWIDMKY